MKIIAGSFPTASVYSISGTVMVGVPLGGSTTLNRHTVESVEQTGAGREYNYAKGGVGIFAGGVLAGPAGALVGGLLPKASKDHTVEFVIRFKDGRVAHCKGTPKDYQAALRAAYKDGPKPGQSRRGAPGWKEERKARRKAVYDSGASFSEKLRMIEEVDNDYK